MSYSNILSYDAVIIGFGKGGKTLAGKLGAAGKAVALIEKSPDMYGGTCINVGCIPSKSLILSASKVDPSLDFKEKSSRYKMAIDEKRSLTSMLRQKNYNKLANLPNVTIYDGTAQFAGPHRVEVLSGDSTLSLCGKQIFINTGSEPRMPPIPGIQTTPGVYTSSQLMELDTLPKHLLIIGGGYIGLEFASMYSNFGSRVTVLQDSDVFLPKEDEDIANEIKSILESKGVKFYLGAAIKEINTGPAIIMDYEESTHRLEPDAILVATGRAPNTRELNCQAAGVQLTSRGAIQVDSRLHTTAEDIWAMGDVTGGLQHTYISLDDSRIVWSQISGKEDNNTLDTSNRKNVPYSVFLSTPYSRVGINEKEALKAGYDIKVAKLSAASVPKAQVLKAPEGMLKAVIDKDTDKILGAMILCEESYEIINIIKPAMDMDADYTLLRDQIFTHPTMSEALNDLFNL